MSDASNFIEVKYMPSADRNKPTTRFAGPGNSFPIRPDHPEDVRNAWNLAGHADNPDKVRAKIRAIARELGVSGSLPKTAEGDKGKSMHLAGETLLTFGDPVKSLSDGKIGGYLVRFSTASDPDLVGDFFTPETDFGLDLSTKTRVIFDHGLDATLKRRRLTVAELKADNVGVWIEGVLEERDEYEKAIGKLVAAGKLGWSSGSASHLIEREDVGKATRITAWPIIEASLTPSPCEPRAVAVPLKSWATKRGTADAGLGYDDSWRDGGAASAAVSYLADCLRMCIWQCFGGFESEGVPAAERMARIRAEFADFTEDSLAVIAALMDDDESTEATKAYIKSRITNESASAHSITSPDGVVSALKGYRDLIRRLAETRESDGRKLGQAKLSDLKSVIDGASPLVADLGALLASQTQPDKAALDAARARVQLLALKRKHAG